MSHFDKLIDHIFKTEGGFVNHPSDKGKATNWGITIGTLTDWRKKMVSVNDVKELSKEEASKIYKAKYWDAMNLDLIKSANVALVLFDQGVNRGTKTAVKLAQSTYNLSRSKDESVLSVDGSLGAMTANALNNMSEKVFLREYLQSCEMAYASLAVNNPSQIVFLKGWLSRIHKLQDEVFI